MTCIRLAMAGSLCLFLIGSVKAQAANPAAESTNGPVLYKEHCAVCHGMDGKGSGPMSRYLKTTPSDLTRLSAHNGGKFPLSRVQRLISGEEELPAGHGSSLMPVWGPVFSQVAWDRDLGRVRIYNLAKYIEGLQK